jgi:hypothetical protein
MGPMESFLPKKGVPSKMEYAKLATRAAQKGASQ